MRVKNVNLFQHCAVQTASMHLALHFVFKITQMAFNQAFSPQQIRHVYWLAQIE